MGPWLGHQRRNTVGREVSEVRRWLSLYLFLPHTLKEKKKKKEKKKAKYNLVQTCVSSPSTNLCISECVFILTVSGAAARVGAAPAADVAAAGVRATLTPTNSNQEQE